MAERRAYAGELRRRQRRATRQGHSRLAPATAEQPDPAEVTRLSERTLDAPERQGPRDEALLAAARTDLLLPRLAPDTRVRLDVARHFLDLAGLLLGQADGRDLGVAEHNARDRRVVGFGGVRGDVGTRDAALVQPTCVNAMTPVTSPIDPTPSKARQRSLIAMPFGSGWTTYNLDTLTIRTA